MKRKSTVIEIVLTYCLFCTCMRVFAIYAWFSCKHACEVIASHISLSKPIYVKAVKTIECSLKVRSIEMKFPNNKDKIAK